MSTSPDLYGSSRTAPSRIGMVLRVMAIQVLCVVAGSLLREKLGEGYASLVYVLGVVAAGAMGGLTTALVAALVATVTFNFFVAEPLMTVTFHRLADFVPPFAFTVTALISGILSGRLRDETVTAGNAMERTERLFQASGDVQAAVRDEDVRDALGRALPGVGLALFRRGPGGLAAVATDADPADHALAADVCAGLAGTLTRGDRVAVRLDGAEGPIGALVARAPDGHPLDVPYLVALGRLVTIALERIALAAHLSEARALARSEELKSTLLSSVSHDLRTPLTAISTAAAGLLEFGDTLTATEAHDLLRGIVDESARLNHLTANLLEMARLQAGEGKLRITVLDAREVLAAVVSRARAVAGTRTLAPQMAPDELPVAVDAVLFDLALTNVVQNALRYSPEASRVTITAAAHDDVCVIAITDEGPGIPEADHARVFERFRRLARPGAPSGSGLGLAIARGFVEASGGTIALASPVAPAATNGRLGTRLTIRLPLVATPAARDAQDGDAEQDHAP